MGVYRTNPAGKILYANHELVNLLGYNSLDELATINLEQEKENNRVTREKFKSEIRKRGSLKSMESIWTKKDGTKIIVSEYARLILDNEGKELFYEGVVEDITKRKITDHKLKNALEKAKESDHLKSSFLATIQHELRTPLNSIMGFSEILLEEDSLGEVNLDYLRLIHQSGQNLLDVINDILDMSLITAGDITIHHQNSNLNFILEQFNNQYNRKLKADEEKSNLELKLTSKMEPGKELISTDPSRLQQVLSNLLDNAIKFTYEGTIEFGCKLIDNSKILFFVKDTGIGIPKNQQAYIFDQFRQADETHTRKFGGSGLGLSISKNLIECLNGEIWLESEPGQGSVFYFTIPYKEEKTMHIFQKPEKTEPKKTYKWNGKKILVAEDNYSNYLLIKTFLRNTGIEPIHAKNGEEAVEIMKTDQDIDLVLMDIQLPGISGHEATQHIKKVNNKIKIIAVTAYSTDKNVEESLDAGCDDHLSKPILINKLLDTINKHI